MRTHIFEYDGQEYTYRSGTIRDKEVRKAITRRILRACGWETGEMPGEDNTGIYAYATALAYLNPVAAPWWRSAGDTPEALVEGYQAFMQEDSELSDLLDTAEVAVRTEKKMTRNGSKK